MPQYLYTAIDRNNAKKSGTLKADDPAQLYRLLEQRALFCTSYKEKIAAEPEGAKKRLKDQELALFCRQLGSMLHAGMSVGDSLDTMRHKAATPALKEQAAALYEKIQKGTSFSDALAAGDAGFPPLMVYLVRSGEVSGQLDTVMIDLYDHYTREYRTHNQVTSAMVYPIILLSVTVIVVTFLMTSVLPSFFSLFDSAAALPWYTRLLMGLSDSLVRFWYLYLLAVLGIFLLFQALGRNPGYVLWRDRMKIRWPLFGKLNKVIYTARFARTFASLFKAGIPVIEALQLCSDVLGNAYYASRFAQGIELIRSGQPIAAAVEQMGCFDDLLVSMIYTGERSGELDAVLDAVGRYYDEESESATAKIVAALQPIMIVILGLIIGFIMLAIIVPIYNMYSSVI